MAARKSASKKQNLVEEEQEVSPHNEIDNIPTIEASDAETEQAQELSEDHDDNNQEAELLFSDCLTLDVIQEFVEISAQKIDDHDELCIDLSKSDEISTAAVQAIICLNRYAIQKEKKLTWKNPTNGFSDAFNSLGFYSEMMKLEFVK